jgi:glutamate synthase (NADPH/NADH) small chain
MGDPTGFLKVERQDRSYRPAEERLQHWKEFVIDRDPGVSSTQASRCMDCGIPFCHTGCPVNNLIPDWNDLVFKNDWKTAIDRLHETNNFPEFTGRICPAPCEAACTLNLQDTPVTIKSIECEIIDRAWAEGWVKPQLAARGTGKRIAIVGSGPAGLACAQQLARQGHNPTVFEKNDRVGGLLRYGIPDFKMEKHLIDRRQAQMEAEGVLFRTGVHIGVDVTLERLMDDYDIVVLAGGSEKPRDLEVPGRDLEGVHFAMEFLTQQNKRNAGDPEEKAAGNRTISAKGKHVIVIGGGDTGSDCIGTSNRQGALSVTQLEIMPEPPARENKLLSWPHWPMKLRTSSSQEEGADREFAIITKEIAGENGKVTTLICERNGERVELKADLVLLAMGFLGPRVDGAVEQSAVNLTDRGNVDAAFGSFRTSNARIFACGDMRRGQSLVVWAIREGRDCANSIHAQLSAETRRAA